MQLLHISRGNRNIPIVFFLLIQSSAWDLFFSTVCVVMCLCCSSCSQMCGSYHHQGPVGRGRVVVWAPHLHFHWGQKTTASLMPSCSRSSHLAGSVSHWWRRSWAAPPPCRRPPALGSAAAPSRWTGTGCPPTPWPRPPGPEGHRRPGSLQSYSRVQRPPQGPKTKLHQLWQQKHAEQRTKKLRILSKEKL